VRREDTKVLPAIEAILATGTQGGAADWLGITEGEFGRMHSRLGQLAKSFLSGEPVPRERGRTRSAPQEINQASGSKLAA